MNWINLMIDRLGASVCHQIPERSLKMGGLILPICARDSGIYIGFFICAIFMFLIFRQRESELPPLYILIILIIFILSTIVDGLLSYLFVIETNNIARFTTGFLAGSSIMAVIYPIFNYQYYKDSYNIRIFVSPIKFIFFIAVDALIIFITLLQIGFLKYFYYYLSAVAVIFTFYFVNLIIILLIPIFSRKAPRLFSKYLVLPAVLALILSSVELFALYKLHAFLINIKI
ncbi:MAG: DUF2085 domain-containing protein [Actinobacteria bacterium]|nr:DUF2085 domain-containing protein [Actinomycetota bacterium]